MEDGSGVKAQVGQEGTVDGAQHPEGHVGNADVHHQIFNSEVRVLIAEALDPIHGISHRILHSGKSLHYNIPCLCAKVYKIL